MLSGLWKGVEGGATVILAGGGYFYSSRRLVNGTLVHLCVQTRVATRLAARVVMMPQSLGPFRHRWDRALCRWALRDVAPVIVRETVSGGSDLKPQVCPDAAFYGFPQAGGIKTDPVEAPTRALGSKELILTAVVMDWRWASGSNESFSSYVEEMRKLVDMAVKRGWTVVLAGHSSMPEQMQDDIALAWTIRESVSNVRTRVFTSTDPDALRNLYRLSDVVVASRLHASIMALVEGTPALALAYQPKAFGTFREIGLGDMVIGIRDFHAETVMGRVEDFQRQAGDVEERVRVAVARARANICGIYDGDLGGR